jgi:tetratricopeptide (TPR) repeat protein
MNFPYEELGKLIRQSRQEQGYRLEDLADDNISVATVSNIERGVSHVSKEKIGYILDKLKLEKNIYIKEGEDRNQLLLQFMSIETLIAADHLELAWSELLSIEISENDGFFAVYLYLKAKCLMHKKELEKAERFFLKAIQYIDSYTNPSLGPKCYCNLSYINFFHNKIEMALLYNQKGIDELTESNSKGFVWYQLHRNKSICLERLDRINESYQTVLQVWEEIDLIDDVDIILSLYWVRSEISRRMRIYDEAEKIAKEGIDKAAKNKKYYSLVTLWMVLGSVYMNLKKWTLAETCFKTAITLEQNHPQIAALTNIYAKLGVLYMSVGKEDLAFDTMLKSIDISIKANNAPFMINNFLILANIYKIRNDVSNSILQYKKAMKLCRKYHYKEKEQLVIYQAALCSMVDKSYRKKYLEELFILQKEFNITHHQTLDDIF